jgi:HK97 family phage major capsid protein
MNDTTNVGRLLAENTQMSETDVVIGTATLGAYVYSSDLTRVSLQLANDSAFDVGRSCRRAHAERIGRITNQHFTTGTGSSQPQGIVTGATSARPPPAWRRSPRTS